MIYFIPWHKIKLEKLQGHNIIPIMGYKFDLLLVSLLLYYYINVYEHMPKLRNIKINFTGRTLQFQNSSISYLKGEK